MVTSLQNYTFSGGLMSTSFSRGGYTTRNRGTSAGSFSPPVLSYTAQTRTTAWQDVGTGLSALVNTAAKGSGKTPFQVIGDVGKGIWGGLTKAFNGVCGLFKLGS